MYPFIYSFKRIVGCVCNILELHCEFSNGNNDRFIEVRISYTLHIRNFYISMFAKFSYTLHGGELIFYLNIIKSVHIVCRHRKGFHVYIFNV